MRKKHFYISLICIVLISNAYANSGLESIFKPCQDIVIVYANSPVGVWEYEVFGVDDLYKKGTLFVREEEDGYSVEVQLSNGTLTGQDVIVKKNTVKFNLNIEGLDRVSIVLMVYDEDTIEGETYSNEGNYKVKGTRKLPPE